MAVVTPVIYLCTSFHSCVHLIEKVNKIDRPLKQNLYNTRIYDQWATVLLKLLLSRL